MISNITSTMMVNVISDRVLSSQEIITGAKLTILILDILLAI